MKLRDFVITSILLVSLSLNVSAQNSSVTDTLTFVMDTVNSYVAWQCDKHNGTVPLKYGIIKIVNNEIVAGNFSMKMDSIKDKDIDYVLMRKTLENTLRSDIFFDTKNYPESNFIIDHTIPAGKNRWIIAGDLWIKGMVSCVQFKSKISFSGKQFIAVSDTLKIDRTIWGITIYSQEEATSDDSVIVSNDIKFTLYMKGYPSKPNNQVN